MLKRLMPVILLIVLAVQPAWAQFPPDLLPPSREELGDTSAAARAAAIDSIAASQTMTGLTGTVAVGVVACADSTDSLKIASYDDPYLNRKLIGFGTGVAGEMRISGMVAATGVTKVGVMYYLDVSGTLKPTMPTATNVWVVEMGRCVATGRLRLIQVKPKARM